MNNKQNIEIAKISERVNSLDKSHQKLSSRFIGLDKYITNHLTSKIAETSNDISWIKKVMFIVLPTLVSMIVTLIWIALKLK